MGTGILESKQVLIKSVQENLPELEKSFEYDAQTGLFGTRGKSKNIAIRNIASDNPVETSKDFYKMLSRGGIETELQNGKGVRTDMKNGIVITYRAVSSSEDKSPAIDIKIPDEAMSSTSIKHQKIHFVKGDRDGTY